MRTTKATAVARRENAPGVLLPLAFLVALSALALSGCNTMSGIGEDVSAAGEKLDETSENTQRNLSDDENPRSRDYQSGRY